MTPVRKPNFFILGAGKCGTTTLYEYLRHHPQIYLSPDKQPTFFSEHFQIVKNPVDYFRLFDGAATERIIGEASHTYMSDPESPRILHAQFPEAKFVVILRHPADRAYSMYHHMCARGYEFAPTFEHALQREHGRMTSPKSAKRFPWSFNNYLYSHSGLFAQQLERYWTWFRPEQFHLLTLSQLQKAPQEAVAAILRFIGADPNYDFEPAHRKATTRTPRWPLLDYWWETRVSRPNRFKEFGRRVLHLINCLDKPPINPATREQLQLRYADDLRQLTNLTGIAL